MAQYVCGVDLSGPANPDDTAAVAFELQDRTLVPAAMELLGASNSQICTYVQDLLECGPVVVGVDAPLSYNPGGGDRPADRSLRQRLKGAGMYHSAAVMPPTMTRMVYLTLRGIALTRMLERPVGEKSLSIVEVHPGACMALSEAPEDALKGSRAEDGQAALDDLMESLGAGDVRVNNRVQSGHHLDAIACAIAARDWLTDDARWCHQADPPTHPYDFVC